jgi:hypothetical protein
MFFNFGYKQIKIKDMKKLLSYSLLLLGILSCKDILKIEEEQIAPSSSKQTLQNARISATTVASGTCPNGWLSIICGGKQNCYPRGYSCCGGKIISSGTCIYCNGYVGVPTGYTCCNGRIIDDKSSCIYCQNQYMVVPKGSYCCMNMVVPAGLKCLSCNGKYQIVGPKCRCINWKTIVCN